MKSQARGHTPELLAEVAALPALPGVYRYFDAQGGVLYVGKARNLKKRVSNYFQKNHGGTRIGHMVTRRSPAWKPRWCAPKRKRCCWKTTSSRRSTAKFNILFRDDKSYPYLKLTRRTPVEGGGGRRLVFPRLAYYRGAVDEKHRYFGPYPSAWAVKDIHPAAAKGVPPAHLRRHGVQQPHPAVPAVPDQALLGALRGPCVARAIRAGRRQRRALSAWARRRPS